MRPVAHQLYVLRCTVNTLAILYGALKHVTEFRFGTKVIRTYKVHHTPKTYNNSRELNLALTNIERAGPAISLDTPSTPGDESDS